MPSVPDTPLTLKEPSTCTSAAWRGLTDAKTMQIINDKNIAFIISPREYETSNPMHHQLIKKTASPEDYSLQRYGPINHLFQIAWFLFVSVPVVSKISMPISRFYDITPVFY
jgi:hypothetical protein